MEDLNYALLAAQSALLDTITPELRAVVIDLDNEKEMFYVRFYHDGEISWNLTDLWECAITEMSADLDGRYGLDNGIERLDFPQPIPVRGRFAFLRKERTYEMQILSDALLATQNALLDAVTPELRSVVVDWDPEKKILYVRFYYEGEIPERLFDLWKSVIRKISSDLNSDYGLDGEVERLDFPQPIPFRGRYAFLRKGGYS